jgi:hypothetical protein
MQDINLLRPLIKTTEREQKKKKTQSFYVSLLIITILVMSVIVFGARIFLSSYANSLDSQISNLQKDAAEADQIENNIQSYNNAIAQLNTIIKGQLSWPQLYDNIAKSTPSDIKLNQVTFVASTGSTSTGTSSSSSAGSGKLKITGETKSRRSIALLQYKLLKTGNNFASVDIISSQKSTSGTQTSGQEQAPAGEKIDFEINITLKNS